VLVRRYGSQVQSVEPKFDPNAITEIAFRRTSDFQMPADEFLASYERVEEHLVTAKSDAAVQRDAQEAILQLLRDQIRDLEASLDKNEVLLFENEPAKDYPREHEKQEGIIVGGQNRLFFHRHVDPPLRFGRYRRADKPASG
jgi:hypothetical protein